VHAQLPPSLRIQSTMALKMSAPNFASGTRPSVAYQNCDSSVIAVCKNYNDSVVIVDSSGSSVDLPHRKSRLQRATMRTIKRRRTRATSCRSLDATVPDVRGC
jgi:hypothetical protein